VLDLRAYVSCVIFFRPLNSLNCAPKQFSVLKHSHKLSNITILNEFNNNNVNQASINFLLNYCKEFVAKNNTSARDRTWNLL